MQVSDFIEATIREITAGLRTADDNLTGGTLRPLDNVAVEFDVGITASEKSTESKNGGLNLSVVTFSGEGGKEVENSKVSRVKFRVTLNLEKS